MHQLVNSAHLQMQMHLSQDTKTPQKQQHLRSYQALEMMTETVVKEVEKGEGEMVKVEEEMETWEGEEDNEHRSQQKVYF